MSSIWWNPATYKKTIHTIIVKYIALQQYYQGNTATANDIDWWMAFELWRRNIAKKIA